MATVRRKKKPTGELSKETVRIVRKIVKDRGASQRTPSAVGTLTASGLDVFLEKALTRPSRAGKGKKGYKGPLRHAVERIRDELERVPTLEESLDRLSDPDWVEDRYMSTTTPINLHIVEVDRDRKELRYTDRKGRDQKRSFRRLQDVINEIAK